MLVAWEGEKDKLMLIADYLERDTTAVNSV